MLTADQIDQFRQKLHAMRASLDDRASTLREEASLGAGGASAAGVRDPRILIVTENRPAIRRARRPTARPACMMSPPASCQTARPVRTPAARNAARMS